MDKPTRSKATKIFSFLPKATSFSINHPPSFSPARENYAKSKTFHNKFFSGPIISVEARRNENKNGGGFDAQEPTSPKVSCIGQVKHKKACRPKPSSPPRVQERKPAFIIRKMFRRNVSPGRRTDAAESSEGRPAVAGIAPSSLGQMQRFTSGRDTLRNFDWRKVEIKQEAATEDPEKCGFSYEESDHEEHDAAIYHSGPIMVGGGMVAMEPRKKVNLWKRRTLAPPVPLQFK